MFELGRIRCSFFCHLDSPQGYRDRHIGDVWRIPDAGVKLSELYDLYNNDFDLQLMHNYFINPDDVSGEAAYFYEASRGVFDAALKYAAAIEADPVEVILSIPDGELLDVLYTLNKYAPVEFGHFISGTDIAKIHENGAARSVWQVFTNSLRTYRDLKPILCPTGIAGVDYVSHDWVVKQQTIYITYPIQVLKPAGSLIGAIVNGLIRQRMTQVDTTQRDIAPLLILIDELAAVKLHDLDSLLATVRGAGIRIVIYVQNLGQLYEIYGVNATNTIIGNCEYQVFHRSQENVTADYVAKMYGDDARLAMTFGQSGSRTSGGRVGRSLGSSESRSMAREQSVAAEWRSMGEEDALLQLDGMYRIRAKRLHPFESDIGDTVTAYKPIESSPTQVLEPIPWEKYKKYTPPGVPLEPIDLKKKPGDKTWMD